MIPFVAALFATSVVSNLISLVGLRSPTSDLSTEAAWAVVVFIMITAQKIKTSGFGGYLKGFTQPIPVMTPFNILSELATPVSMACRHFGNILTPEVMKQAVELIDGRAQTECSGNITKENIQKIREIGVDFVSSGALTHSAPILDISMKNLHAV